MRVLILIVLAGLLTVQLAACTRDAPTLEQRAQRLDQQLICPVCPGETLDQSNVQVARDMRALIRERLAAGDNEDQIKDYFVDRYGTRVLAAPPASGIGALVWAIPPVALAAGLAGLYFIVREMRRRVRRGGDGTAQSGPAASTTDPALTPYLEEVDRELGERPGRPG